MRYLIILTCAVLLPYIGNTQVQFHSLDEVLSYADEHGITASQARLQPEIAKQDVKLTSSSLYPRVNTFSTADYFPIIPTQVIPAEVLGGQPGTYYKAQFGLPYVFTAGAEVSMPVINLEKWAQLAKARAQYRQAVWSSKAAVENYHIQLIQAYYQMLVAKEMQKLNMENQSVVDELARIMTERKNADILNPSDYNRSLNLQLDVRSTGINYERSINQYRNNLIALLTTTANDTIQILDSIDNFNWPILQEKGDIADRAAMQEANLKLHVAELSFDESKRAGLPKLNLNGRYVYNSQSKLESNSQAVEFSTASIGLRLDFPVFQGNYYRALKKKSELQLQYAKLDLERTGSILSQQQLDWMNQYNTAFNRHFILEDKLATNTDNLRIARLNLKEGVMEFDEFNNIFMEYNRAKMDYIQNLADGILFYLLSTQKF